MRDRVEPTRAFQAGGNVQFVPWGTAGITIDVSHIRYEQNEEKGATFLVEKIKMALLWQLIASVAPYCLA